MHYVKLWSSILDGTLRGDWEARVIFEDLMLLANADGVVDMTREAIAGRTGAPLRVVKGAIERLQCEDPQSRRTEAGGARIVRLFPNRDWGWLIVNFAYYRGLQSDDRTRELAAARMRRKRERDRTADPPAAESVTVTRGDAYYARKEVGGRRKKGEGRDLLLSSSTEETTNPPQSSNVGGATTTSILIPIRARARSATVVEVSLDPEELATLVREYPGIDIPRQLIEIRRWCLEQASKPNRGALWISALAGIHRWLRRECRSPGGREGPPRANPRAAVDAAYRDANRGGNAPEGREG